MRRLFDHFIGAREDGRRDYETHCFCGFEIDYQRVLVRCLHRKLGRLLALEDAIDVARGAPIEIDRVGPIGQQAALDGLATDRVDGREAVACRQCLTREQCCHRR